MPLVQLRLRRRTFLLASAALVCGGEPDQPTTAGDAGDTIDEPDVTTTDATPTTGPIGPITEPATTAGDTTANTDDTGASCTPVGVDTGLTVADFPVGACLAPDDLSGIYVLRDDQGFYAISNRCTHTGCIVPCPVDGVMTCPCHGSEYNANGDVQVGPALDDLRHYPVSFECVGDLVKIYVDDTNILDDRQTRAEPP